MIQSGLDFFAPPCGHSQSDVEQVIAILRRGSGQYAPAFQAWLVDNWHIWTAFEREADKVYRTGRTHYSARTIVEVLRHHTALQSKDALFKITNNVCPDLARLYMAVNPEREGFFERRLLPTSPRQA